MLRSLARALGQLDDPRLQRLALRCVLAALGLFVLLALVVGTGLALFDLTEVPLLNTAIVFFGSGVTLVLAWLLFPAALLALLGLFADDVAAAVEQRYYPELPPAKGLPFFEGLLASVRFSLFALFLNLLALPLYLVPVVNAVLFFALNGYLVGREYFEVVAQRRLGVRAASSARREVRGQVWIAGAILAMMLTLPVFNLLVPIVGIAFMVHEFRRHHAPLGRLTGPTA